MKSGKISILIKLLILVLVAYGTFTLAAMREEISLVQDKANMLTAAISTAESENAQIRDEIAALETDEGVEAIARSELGLVGAGEILFQDVGT